MQIIRPIQGKDLPSLLRFAEESGHGFTSLPQHEDHLRTKIERAEAAFAQGPGPDGEAGFLFVLEDDGVVIGTSAIEARVGLADTLYHYHLGKVVHRSQALGIRNSVDVLTLCNDYTGVTEICTLFLTPAARARHSGDLLSRFRFLFIAQHPDDFADTVIAEMRGVSDEQGQSPFWGWLQQHFFSMPLADAVYRVGMGQKSFIAELMPTYPVYVSLLDASAQAVIGQVHQQTVPALRMLESEGFRYRGYIDPFDAGPTVEAYPENIRSIRNSLDCTVSIADGVVARERLLIANDRREDFRATLVGGQLNTDEASVIVDSAVARALDVAAGATVRVLKRG